MTERIEGWAAIAGYFPGSFSKFYRLHAQNMLSAGFVFRTHADQGISKKNP